MILLTTKIYGLRDFYVEYGFGWTLPWYSPHLLYPILLQEDLWRFVPYTNKDFFLISRNSSSLLILSVLSTCNTNA